MIKQTRVENGELRGVPGADPRVYVYRGVPYAAPPVGDLRWHAPVPAEDWEGVRDCARFAPISMQNVPGSVDNIYRKEWNVDQEIEMSEDCLYLNIWTPAKDPSDRLPVFVWYFGGGLQEGNTQEMEFNGERLARRGIVVVTVNYRLNCFGFLCHPEITAENPDLPSSFGNLDQRFGTMWVKRNIAAFGGDPENITIGGQSSGGMSVATQLTSPLNEGLFQKAALISGTMFTPYRAMSSNRTLEQAEADGIDFFEFLGVKDLAEARKIDAFELRDHFDDYKKARAEKGLRTMWGTVIDGKYVIGNENDLMMQNRRWMVPLFMGHVSGDFVNRPGCGSIEELKDLTVRSFGEELAPGFLGLIEGMDTEEANKAATINANELAIRCTLEATEEKDPSLPTWFYRFYADLPGEDHPGAFHSSDLWFWFESLGACWRPFTGKDYDLARLMSNYLANFIKTADPNGSDVTGEPMPVWKRYSEEKTAMVFTDTARMEESSTETPWMAKTREYYMNNR